MFTGIIKEVGRVNKVIKRGPLTKFAIETSQIGQDSEISDSVSINGVCLTLVNKENNLLFFDAISSTLSKTNLKRLKKHDYVNLEPALKVGDKLGGHFVLGHVDAEAKLYKKTKFKDYWDLDVELVSSYRKHILENGSVALEGISLTVKRIFPRMFSVNIIPFTYDHTNLKYKKAGDWLNIEFDHLLRNRGVAQLG